MSVERQVKLFRNGRNQAVRIPREFELEGTVALMYREEDRVIIEPLRRRGLLATLESCQHWKKSSRMWIEGCCLWILLSDAPSVLFAGYEHSL